MLILDGFLESLDHLRIDLLEWGESLDRNLEKFLDGMLKTLDPLRRDLEILVG